MIALLFDVTPDGSPEWMSIFIVQICMVLHYYEKQRGYCQAEDVSLRHFPETSLDFPS